MDLPVGPSTHLLEAPMDRLDMLLEDIRSFVNEREFDAYHDPKNLAMAIASEAGELTAELRWVPSQSADDHCREPEARQRITDEIADVAICLLMLCDRIGVDLPAAVHDKLVRTRQKYPVDPSGTPPVPPSGRFGRPA
ncbi:MAG: nucleotide pyrophosphohydrolase [Polyangiales bacterium]